MLVDLFLQNWHIFVATRYNLHSRKYDLWLILGDIFVEMKSTSDIQIYYRCHGDLNIFSGKNQGPLFPK